VKAVFDEILQDDRRSSAARVVAGERLLPGDDTALRLEICREMEDVIHDLTLSGRSRYQGDLIDDALDVTEIIDRARADGLAERYRRQRSEKVHDSKRRWSVRTTPSVRLLEKGRRPDWTGLSESRSFPVES
jgi:hypothetical protein